MKASARRRVAIYRELNHNPSWQFLKQQLMASRTDGDTEPLANQKQGMDVPDQWEAGAGRDGVTLRRHVHGRGPPDIQYTL